MVLTERLDQQTLADRHVAAVLLAAGASDVQLPTLHEQRALFDAALVAEPKAEHSHLDPEQLELRRALGVA